MDGYFVDLLVLRIIISCIGFVGNVLLIFSVIIHSKLSRVKSFELFLLGLATANLEEILIMNISEIIVVKLSFFQNGIWICRSLRFLTVFGEITSIFFSVLISIFRYEKLRDTNKRANFPVFLDSIRSAWMVSGVCVMISTLLSFPIFVLDVQNPAVNVTINSSTCPPDFFQCSKKDCPTPNLFYKYLFIVMCNLLPLIIVTVTSCLIIMVLLSQSHTVTPEEIVHGLSHHGNKKLQHSIIAVLAAMGLFQINWTFYLIFQLIFNATDFPFWAEIERFITTSYISISPYVYGIGSHLFSVKNLIKS
ncbi:gonadotropin-releasing hormone receptor [Mastacembelus armatus]|uniref:gonadotropin-releasing hormone receptor n=1 Tax=Mastacembelus armatus TaxID=205130 RepID=UPI000E462208|nr:gonadotropin-releasing hormone receptor-like [Mastacembelus armatus]